MQNSIIVKALIALHTSILFTFVFIVFISPFYILRQIVQIAAKILRPDFIRGVSLRSSVWTTDAIYSSPESNITIIMVFDKKLQHSLLRKDVLANGLPKYDRLQHYFETWYGYSFWKLDKTFSVDNHLIKDDQKVFGQQELIDYANKISRYAWTEKRSPWSARHIDNYQAHAQEESTSAIIFNIHHSLSDAFGAQCILMSMIGTKKLSPPPYNDITLPPRQGDKGMPKILLCVNSIYTLASDLVRIKDSNALRRFGLRTKERDIAYISRKIEDKVQVTVPYEKIQQILDEYKVSATALMGALAGSCLERICALEQLEAPEYVHLMTPYSVPGHSRQMTNHQGFVFLNVPIKGKTLQERLAFTECEVNRLREARISKFFEVGIPLLLGALPVFLIKHLYKVDLSTAMLISIKIDEAMVYHESKVTDISFLSGPLPGDQAIFFFFMTYAQTFKIGLALNTSFRSRVNLEQILETMVDNIS